MEKYDLDLKQTQTQVTTTLLMLMSIANENDENYKIYQDLAIDRDIEIKQVENIKKERVEEIVITSSIALFCDQSIRNMVDHYKDNIINQIKDKFVKLGAIGGNIFYANIVILYLYLKS